MNSQDGCIAARGSGQSCIDVSGNECLDSDVVSLRDLVRAAKLYEISDARKIGRSGHLVVPEIVVPEEARESNTETTLH